MQPCELLHVMLQKPGNQMVLELVWQENETVGFMFFQ